MPDWKVWEKAIRRACKQAERREFAPYRDMTLDIKEPLPLAELESLEASVGPLPSDYKNALAATRSVTFSYVCNATLDDVLVNCVGPIEALWDDRYLLWCGRVAAEFGYFEPGSEGQWITPFAHLEDDDFLAFRMDGSDRDGEVFLAAHDDHEARPTVAKTFAEFVDRWSALHFPDFESMLRHFWNRDVGEITCDGPAVDKWLAWVRQTRR